MIKPTTSDIFLFCLGLVSIQIDDDQLHDTNHNTRNVWRLNTHSNQQPFSTLTTTAMGTTDNSTHTNAHTHT